MKLYYFYTLKALWDGQGKIKIHYGMCKVKKQLSGKRSIKQEWFSHNIIFTLCTLRVSQKKSSATFNHSSSKTLNNIPTNFRKTKSVHLFVMLSGTVVHNKNNTTKSQVTNGIFQFYHHLLHSDVIIYSKHIQEYSLSLDWLNIFYVLLTLILQYPTMFEGLINSSKIALLNFRHYPHLTSGGDQLLFYLQCIVFVSDLFFYRDIGNNSCFSFQMTCCICLVSSFHTVIFPVTLKLWWVQILHCTFRMRIPSLKSHWKYYSIFARKKLLYCSNFP